MANNTVLLSRPIKEDCIFNAVGNPVIYKLRREDYQFDQINDDGGFAQIQINGTDLTTYFQVDDTVYIEELGAATVTASSFSTNTLITVDLAFVATATGFINNNSKRTDYKIEAEVFGPLSLGPRIVQDPGENGEVLVNISGIVKAYLAANWQMPSVNEVETETSREVFIKYQEFYDDTYWDLQIDAESIVCVFALMQLLQNSPPDFSRYAHGGNMLSYCPEDSDRMFLTRFVSVSMWRGFPFTLSFIWPDISDINRRVKQYDSTGAELVDVVTVLDPTINKVHRMTVGDLETTAVRMLVNLEDGTMSGSDQITEELEVLVKDPCENQLLLFWKNAKGGDSFWMFDESQDYEYTYPSGRKVQRMTLFADNLLTHEWDAINELNSPSDVFSLNITDTGMDDSIDKTHFRNDNQVFIVNEDLSKVGVIVVPNNNRTKTMYRKHSIEITIELPELFTV